MNQHGAMQMHGARPPFTPSQWQELEHQALIFKYILAGIPVPPDLLVPIKKSLEALGPSFFHQHHHHHHHHPNMPWSSFHLGFAKNCDPEPGRCRRTDGKKWRCSKDAFPDSKYCERHMHRGRNRSRKPVENLVSHSSSSLSLSTTASHRNNSNMSSNSTLSFTHTPYSSSSSRLSNNAFHQHPSSANTSNLSDFAIDNSGSSYALPSKDYRYMKGDIDEHVFFRSEDNRVGMGESGGGGAWRSIPSKSNQQSAKHEHHQYSFLNSSFGGGEMEVQMEMENSSSSSSVVSAVGVKMEEQPLRHFFDDWPRSTRDTTAMTWNDIDDDRSNRRSSTTQLSISIPITSDFSPPRACK